MNSAEPSAARDRLSMIDLKSAVAHKGVDFSAVELVRRRAEKNPDFEEYYPTVLEAFQNTNGPMMQTFFFQPGAVTITLAPRRWRAHWIGLRRNPTIHSVLDTSEAPADVLSLYVRCDNLARRVDQTLRGERREVSTNAALAMLSHLLGCLDRPEEQEVPKAEIVWAAESLDFEEAVFDRAAITTLKGRFLAGMASALPLVAALGALATWLLSRAELQNFEKSDYIVSFAMGSIGAIVGAMRRMNTTMGITPDTSRAAAFASGMSRPFVGAVFATVIYFALTSGLLGISLSGSEGKQFFAIATLGFIAGLSERIARGMLSAVPGADTLRDDAATQAVPDLARTAQPRLGEPVVTPSADGRKSVPCPERARRRCSLIGFLRSCFR